MSWFRIKLYKLYLDIISCFISNKKKRRKFRKVIFHKFINTYIKKFRFGISYSVFDGEELLETSIKSIKKSVDYVNVIYQTKSWYGVSCNTNLLTTLYDLKDKGLIDELIEYIPNTLLSPSKQETRKRNIGLKYAKKAGVNYFMTMDCDEFYIRKEIELVKKSIVENNITHSYCPIVNYGLKPTDRILNIANFCVPFFAKINLFSKIKNFKTICICDPTRKVCKPKLFYKPFFFTDIQMHHFSYIRNNLEKKLENSSNYDIKSTNVKNIYKNRHIYLQVENTFNIPNLNKN